MKIKYILPLVLLIPLVFLLTTLKEPPQKTLQKPNIVFIVADALRADRLSLYGYERKTSPFLDSLGPTSIVFQNVKSPSSWTLPSMISIFTGISPISFYAKGDAAPDEINFITEILQQEGYHTYGICANPHLGLHTNFIQGFTHFEYIDSSDGKEINASLSEKLYPKMEEPFFLWLHYMDVHGPYAPPHEMARAFNPDLSVSYMKPGNFEKSPLNDRDMRYASDLYDGEILYWDGLLREVFDLLSPVPNTLWVITSDHGDEFHEHGGIGHGVSLYEELLHIPLIMHNKEIFPRGRVIKGPVSGIDLLPTILYLSQIDPKDPAIEGRQVFTTPSSPEPSFASIWEWPPRISKSLKAIYKDNWKYIHDYTRSDHRLYDLSKDPQEKKNLVGEYPEVAAEMERALRGYVYNNLMKFKRKARQEVDQGIEERLKALGY